MPSFRVWIALSALAALGCPGPSDPPPPVPPVVDVSFPVANVAGTAIKIRISVSGCAQVSSVTLTDRDQPLAIPAFVSNPLEFELTKDQISFRDGVRAAMLLKAKATCADGTSAESIPVGGTFFPVQQVISAPTTGPAASAVADVFYIDEPVAGSQHFYGCMRMANGTRAIAKTTNEGGLLSTVTGAPFTCRASGPGVQYTGLTGTAWHWLFDPLQGAFPYSSTMTAGALHLTNIKTNEGAMGFAPALSNQALTLRGDGSYIQLWSSSAGIWDGDDTALYDGFYARFQSWLGPPRGVAGAPTKYFFSSFFSAHDAGENVTAVWELAEGNPVRFPVLTEYVHFKSTAPARTSTFNKAATRVYYAQAIDAATTQIVSCAARAADCGSKKTSVSLPAAIGALAVYSNDSRLLAVGARQAWVLDAETLQVLNTDGNPWITTGALEWKYIDFGPGEQVALMSGATSVTLPSEVVVYESATAPELYRFESPADSLYLAFGSGGQAWLRHGSQLLKLLNAAEYKALRTR